MGLKRNHKIIRNEVIHFFQGKYENPIGKAESGKTALIDKDNFGIIKPLEDWEVHIIDEKEKFVIVVPFKRIKTKEENSILIEESLEKLQNKWGKMKS